MSSSKSPTTFEKLPADVLQNITSRLRRFDQKNTRMASKATLQAITDPFQNQKAKIEELVQIFRTAEMMKRPRIKVPKPYETQEYAAVNLVNGTDIWLIAFVYKDNGDLNFPSLTEMMVIKARNDKQEVEGAIRMYFEQKKLHSYKTSDKLWLIAFLYTVKEWFENRDTYRATLDSLSIPHTKFDDFFLPYKRENIKRFAHLIWTRKRREDKSFANQMRQTESAMFPEKPPRTLRTRVQSPVASAEPSEGKQIIEQMRLLSKARTAHLAEGMLGHTDAVKKLLKPR